MIYYVEKTAVLGHLYSPKPNFNSYEMEDIKMLSRQRLLLIFLIIMGLTVLLVGCTRPAPKDEAMAGVSEPPDTSDPNVGGGTSLDPTSAPDVAAPEAAPETESAETEADESEAGYPAAEASIDVEATAVPATVEAVEATATLEPAPEEETVAEEGKEETAVTAETSSVTCPPEHVVQPGENLFRIGLQYGLSWVTLAQYNGISNPNNITVGQTIKILCDKEVQLPVQPTLSPDNVTHYTVQPGNNLYQIGSKFGVSWVEIAEANGLVNPNQIYAGQVLKIPTSAPGDRPEFTHIVKPGETVYSISLQYGVPTAAIAEANNLEYPYVIYAGQPLIIPGNS
ncbi:MAG: hypothetical protein CSB13_05255 [Chloroflexi bacterium]|nr:MAG: hypothetical protein CSB13_05255 [Chloroflexota bacterium]